MDTPRYKPKEQLLFFQQPQTQGPITFFSATPSANYLFFQQPQTQGPITFFSATPSANYLFSATTNPQTDAPPLITANKKAALRRRPLSNPY
jgi:hypothetical protein